MNKKVIGFLCGVAACSMLTACSGQEAAPTAASVSQSMPASSESIPVSLNNPATQSFDKWVAASEASLNQRYEQALEGFTKAEGKTVHGFQVYTDEAGDEYIISGVTPVKLRDGNIPESAAQNLRTEKTYQKVILTDQSTADYIKESYEYFKDSLEKSSARSFDQYVSTEYDFTGLNVEHIFLNNVPIDIDPGKANMTTNLDTMYPNLAQTQEFRSKMYFSESYLPILLKLLADGNSLNYTPPNMIEDPHLIERTYADGTVEEFTIYIEDKQLIIEHGSDKDVSTLLRVDRFGNLDFDSKLNSNARYFSVVDLCNALQVYIDYIPSEAEDGSGGILNFITDTYDVVTPENVRATDGDGTDLTQEYEYQTSKEFTEEEAAIYKDQETLREHQYQESYDMFIRMGASEEEAAKMAQEILDEVDAHYEETKAADEAYRQRSEEVGKWYGEESDKLYLEHFGMTFEEFMQIEDSVVMGQLQYQAKQSGFYEAMEKLEEEYQVRLHGE